MNRTLALKKKKYFDSRPSPFFFSQDEEKRKKKKKNSSPGESFHHRLSPPRTDERSRDTGTLGRCSMTRVSSPPVAKRIYRSRRWKVGGGVGGFLGYSSIVKESEWLWAG